MERLSKKRGLSECIGGPELKANGSMLLLFSSFYFVSLFSFAACSPSSILILLCLLTPWPRSLSLYSLVMGS